MCYNKAMMKTRGPEILKLRQAAGVGRQQLADDAGCSYAHLRWCERGDREMSDELYHKLHLSLRELIRKRDEAFEQAREELATSGSSGQTKPQAAGG